MATWSTEQSLSESLPFLASVPAPCAAGLGLEAPPELLPREELMFCLCH